MGDDGHRQVTQLTSKAADAVFKSLEVFCHELTTQNSLCDRKHLKRDVHELAVRCHVAGGTQVVVSNIAEEFTPHPVLTFGVELDWSDGGFLVVSEQRFYRTSRIVNPLNNRIFRNRQFFYRS